MKRLSLILFLSIGLLATARPGFAETRRLAVVVGNNVGSGPRPPLRFAEEDAARMAQVLGELGGIAPAELFLLRGEPLASVREAMAAVEQRIKDWGRTTQTVLLFYFSGHSDGQSLEIAAERLPFAELRQWLRRTDADVRLAFLDSCHSGGLLALKGGTPGPSFDIRFADNMESTGEVLITSSAADESALESAELGASFFSHHLISGLRGAADLSGDGLVTLSEAYQYAFARTLSATTNTVIGPQHANYDYRLSGRGELVLTRIRTPAALIELPAGFERVLVSDADSDRVIAEVGPQGARRLAVVAGRYQVRGWRQHGLFGRDLQVASGQTVTVPASSLQSWSTSRHQAKGEDESSRPGAGLAHTWGLGLALGSTRSVAEDVGFAPGFLPSLRTSLTRQVRAWRAGLTLEMAAFQNQSKREAQTQISASFGRVFEKGRTQGVLAFEVGGGASQQRSQDERSYVSGLVSTAVVLEGAVRVSRHWSAELVGRAPATFLRLAGGTTVRFTPAAWAGASYAW